MKITEIEIKNFKAFYGTYRIDLRKSGKNLLIYGENGSGKSSLYFALKLFLESGEDPSHRFENDQNIFITDAGCIRLCLRTDQGSKQNIYEWSENVRETDDELIIEGSRAKGFLDYKSLLETHYVHRESNTVIRIVLRPDKIGIQSNWSAGIGDIGILLPNRLQRQTEYVSCLCCEFG